MGGSNSKQVDNAPIIGLPSGNNSTVPFPDQLSEASSSPSKESCSSGGCPNSSGGCPKSTAENSGGSDPQSFA